MLPVVLVALAVGLLSLYLFRGVLFSTAKKVEQVVEDFGDDGSFVDRLVSQKKRLAIFYGSQTGTAEEYALKIAREVKSRYGTSPLVLDPESNEIDQLDKVPEDCVVVFVMATYGEGEPTDNAVPMMEFLEAKDVTFSNGESSLDNLHYVAFGLGNKTYEYYNETIRQLDNRLQQLGAHRISARGEGDDDGNLEEDYLAWKDPMFAELASYLELEEGAAGDVSDFAVREAGDDSFPENKVFQGEYHSRALAGVRGNYDGKNPYAAPVADVRELFVQGVADRTCVHAEFDITGSGITYQHGDHLGVWPVNPQTQVDRILAVLGLSAKRDTVIQITSLDPQLAKVPFPQPTTYETVFRYYLDINAHASRQAMSVFAPFAPSDAARAELERLSKDRDYFHKHVAAYGYKLAEVLQLAAGDSLADTEIDRATVWHVPFDRVISAVPRVGPRFYSISSSPKISPDRIHITAVALQYMSESGGTSMHGLASNFLSAVKIAQNNEKPVEPTDPRTGTPRYVLDGPRGKYAEPSAETGDTHYRVPIHVRRSTFRLPTSTKVPIIMVGPGTGVAPFRSFVQERVATARKAKAKLGPDALRDWADVWLFYGCRRSNEDFLYQDEWAEYAKELDGKLNVRVSLSREVFKPDGAKRYVQDLLLEDRVKLADQIVNQHAYLYVCGEAKGMAQDVEQVFAQIIAEARGVDENAGKAELKQLKERGRLMLDVWS